MRTLKLTALSAIIGLACAGQALATNYEVWVSDQTNTQGFAAATPAGTFGGTLRVYDSADLDANPIVNNPTNIDVTSLWPNSLAQTGSNLVRIHGMLPSPNHNYLNVNFVGSGHVGIIDARTQAAVALFRTTGTSTGRQNHMSFWSPDGKYLLVANQAGKLFERINITWDNSGQNITSAVFDGAATLDLVGGVGRITAQPLADASAGLVGSVSGTAADGQSTTTPNGVLKQDAVKRPNNTNICPIASSDGKHAYVTLGGGGMFVVDYTTTPMQIVGEYTKSAIREAGCGGMEGGGFVHLNTGTPGLNKSEFSVYRFPLSYPSAPSYYPENTPAPKVVYADVLNGTTTVANGNRDAHGMGKTATRSYLHQFDRVQNNVAVFHMGTMQGVKPTGATSFGGATYSLLTTDGTLPSLGGVASGLCVPTVGAGNPTVPGAVATADPTPDLLDLSPNGNRMYVALRGVVPLSVGHAASGSCPGLGIVEFTDGGSKGKLVSVLPTSNPALFTGPQTIAGVGTVTFTAGDNISDPHGSVVRLK